MASRSHDGQDADTLLRICVRSAARSRPSLIDAVAHKVLKAGKV